MSKPTLKHYKIVFLVPVYESPECVEDLINNIHTLCPNSAILLHVNSNSPDSFFNDVQKLVNEYEFVYLFPKKYPSDWGHGYLGIIYIEMMDWCLSNLSFDYVYQTASNSLVVNPQLEDKIYDFEAYCYNPGTKSSGDWWDKISLDNGLFEYIKRKDNKIYVCITEGLAMNVRSCKLMVDDLINYIPKTKVDYPTEEYWIPTSFQHIKKQIKYKDKCLEKWAHGKDEWLDLLSLPVDRISDYVINLVITDSFDILSKTHCFSLKRIHRKYNDIFRKTIREHFKYYNRVF